MKVPNKKQFAYAITQRFIMAMDDIISKSKGKVTAASFSHKVKMSASNISRLRNSNGEHSVTLEALGRICEVYKISPYWLITGKGEKYGNAELFAAYGSLDARVQDIETALTQAEAALKIIKNGKQKTRK